MEQLILRINKDRDRLKVAIQKSLKIKPRELDFEFPTEPLLDREKFEQSSMRDLGIKLFSSIFQGDVGNTYRSALARAKVNLEGLVLYLDLDESIAIWPWELMYDSQNPIGYICLDPQQTLIRVVQSSYSDTAKSQTQLPLPIKMLHVVAIARDYPPFSPSPLPESIQSYLQKGMIEIDQIAGPGTLEQLHEKTTEAPGKRESYSIVLIEAHGGIDSGFGEILLCDSQGAGTLVSSERLSVALGTFGDLRVAILNCCQTGETGSSFKYSSLARSLTAHGIPVVVGINGTIEDSNANLFNQTFLVQLIRAQRPIAQALTHTRKRMFHDAESGSQFYLPALYSSFDSNSAFNVAFDSSRINLQHLNIISQQSVEKRAVVPRQVPLMCRKSALGVI